jgi:hypothetical protein
MYLIFALVLPKISCSLAVFTQYFCIARIKRKSLVNGASGMVAGDIVFKTYYVETVISKKPEMNNRVLSEK